MKTITRILLLQSTLAVSCLADQPAKTVPIAWMQISAITQNLQFYLAEGREFLQQRGPDYLENAQKRVQTLLDGLVENGSLVKETISLKALEDIGDGFDEIIGFAEEIGQSYGYYVSLELIDFGIRRSLAQRWGDRDKPLTLVVHLPKGHLKQFKELFNKNEMIVGQGEEIIIEDPADNPEPDSEDGE